MLTQERLKEVLYYNPEIGEFIWNISHENIREGDVAGTKTDFGYIAIRIDNKIYKAHRLAWIS